MMRLHPNHRNATATVLGALLVDKVACYTRIYRPKDIQRDLKIDLNIDISYKKSWRGRKKAFDMAMGSPAESFAQLPYYCHNLKMANEGTVTHIETDAEGCFKLLYVGFSVAIRAFSTSMRPLIIIDGAYLEGTYKGTNLLAVRMDGNNQIVPITTGVCEGGESTKAWSFFLRKLKESIGVVQDMTVISDRHPGIRETLQNWFTTCREKYKDASVDELMEWAAAKVHRRKLKSAKWIVDEVDKRQVYQVNDLRNIEIVDLDSHECTCPKWQLFGLPCGHVIATYVYLKLTNCCLFAKHWFRKTTVRDTYKDMVYPLQGPSLWETTMSSSRKTPICEAKFTKIEANEVKKEHIDMNPGKISEQNQGMSKYFLFEDNELTLIEDYDDNHVYNEDTYGSTYVDPDCYYEEANAIKEVQ
nr:transposase, MuDR, MULE transposase domain protein [Tanacetum cinerariifolium]